MILQLLKLDFVGPDFCNVWCTCTASEYDDIVAEVEDTMGADDFKTHASFSLGSVDKTASVKIVAARMTRAMLMGQAKEFVFNIGSFFYRCLWFRVVADENGNQPHQLDNVGKVFMAFYWLGKWVF